MAIQIDLGAVMQVPKGNWDASTVYERANLVRHNSKAWICKVNQSVGVEPTEDSTDWYLLVKDTSAVTSINGQTGDVTLNYVTPEEVDEKVANVASTMVGASNEISGKSGIVPQPVAGDNARFLRGDGTWSSTNCLPLTGGTVYDIKFPNSGQIRTSGNNTSFALTIFGDPDNFSYSRFYVNAPTNSSPGEAGIIANDGTTEQKLKALPNGMLSWAGKNIVRTINGNNADINGNITPEQTGCLPLSGGTMTGATYIKSPYNASRIYSFGKPTPDSNDNLTNIDIGWNYENGDGAGIGLRSADFQGNGTPNDAGCFAIYAKSGTTVINLTGRIDGSLTWGKKTVATFDTSGKLVFPNGSTMWVA